ncbi:reverse transcriptase domain-containing protein [Bacteroides fragilis]
MKRFGNLYYRICDIDNLYLAYTKARKGKGNTYGVIQFEKGLDDNINALHKKLLEGKYVTSEYQTFIIHDPKEREIYRLPFRDRVVHHAIMNILEDIWTPIFISHTYSCIKGRGIHGVMKHLKKDLKDIQNTKYCLKMDIRKYYPSIDHLILKNIVRKKVKDKRLLELLYGIIDSAPGIPIGNYLSQFFANLYLSYFDHWLKEERRIKYYYRYADDMVILSSNKEELHSLLGDIKSYLHNKLHLNLKDNYQIFPVDNRGIDFVGYVFFHTHILMRKSIKKNFCRKVAVLNKKKTTSCNCKIALCSWMGWAKHCNSKHLIKTVIKNEKVF